MLPAGKARRAGLAGALPRSERARPTARSAAASSPRRSFRLSPRDYFEEGASVRSLRQVSRVGPIVDVGTWTACAVTIVESAGKNVDVLVVVVMLEFRHVVTSIPLHEDNDLPALRVLVQHFAP